MPDSREVSGLEADASLNTLMGSLANSRRLSLPDRTTASSLKAPIFVVGCPRSGTTVLGNCLAAHSQLRGAEESLFLLDLWRIVIDLHQGLNPRNWAPLADFLPLSSLIDASAELSDRIFSGLLLHANDARVIDHTPWYVALVPLLRSIYPDCQILHLIRDGRDVVASLSKSYELGFRWAGNSIRSRTLLWSGLVNAGRFASREMNSEQYREVRYEELCANPDETLNQILQWCGLKWDAAVLEPLSRQHASPARAASTLAIVDNRGGVHLTPKEVGGSWPEDWSLEDKTAFAEHGNSTLIELGYPSLSENE